MATADEATKKDTMSSFLTQTKNVVRLQRQLEQAAARVHELNYVIEDATRTIEEALLNGGDKEDLLVEVLRILKEEEDAEKD